MHRDIEERLYEHCKHVNVGRKVGVCKNSVIHILQFQNFQLNSSLFFSWNSRLRQWYFSNGNPLCKVGFKAHVHKRYINANPVIQVARCLR